MTASELHDLANRLRAERAIRLAEVASTEEELRALTDERDAEFEERAREERLVRTVGELDERDERAIDAISRALDRIADGSYGRCIECGAEIPLERLRAMPVTEHCLVHARLADESASEPATDASHREAVAPDVERLDDDELETAVREALEQDGRIDLQELEIGVRDGVVHLAGALPSQNELDRVRKIITDVVGIPDVDDHVRIEGLAWQRGDRTPATGEVDDDVRDVVESEEQGIGWSAPDTPLPDEEEP